MSGIDFSKPLTLETAIEAVSVCLHGALVCLRDHVAFDGQDTGKTLRAAIFLSSMMEDSKVEIESLIASLEKQESGLGERA